MLFSALLVISALTIGAAPQDPPPDTPPKPIEHRAEAKVPARGALNAEILKTLRAYPTDGTHAYYWPKSGTWAGNTKDLSYQGAVFAKGDPEKRCYCCGITFEVFFDAWKAWCAAEKTEFRFPGIADAAALKQFRKLWFGSDGDQSTMQHALIEAKLGVKIEKLEDAEAGDFVQFWRNSGSGHAVIFLGWERDKQSQAITALHYWSAQGSTKGIGERTEKIGKGEKEIDRARIYIGRVGVAQTKPIKGRGKKTP